MMRDVTEGFDVGVTDMNKGYRIDHTGQKFGEIEVLGFAHIKGNTRYWHTRCSCGHKMPRDIPNLRKSKAQCCRKCSYIDPSYFDDERVKARKDASHLTPLIPGQKDWSGFKAGQIQVVSFIGGYKGTARWKCICECGREILRNPAQIIDTSSCGECKRGPKNPQWKGCGDISSVLFGRIRRGAKRKGISFEITIEEIWSLFEAQDGRCALTGWPIDFAIGSTTKEKLTITASLDRIDSSLGYVLSNLQWLHRDVNYLKRNYPNDRFIELCQSVASNLSGETPKDAPERVFEFLSKGSKNENS